MAELETYDELAVPRGAEVLGVFVNGVPLVGRATATRCCPTAST